MAPLVILGCGYVGTRLAKAALADGRNVRVCSRSTGRLQPLGQLGAEIKFLDASTPKQFTAALSSMAGATVVYSIPPVTSLPPGHAMRAGLQAAYAQDPNTVLGEGIDAVFTKGFPVSYFLSAMDRVRVSHAYTQSQQTA